MTIAIRAEHLSKEYRLGTINHGMLFRDIQSWLARKRGRPDPHEKIGTAHYDDQPDRFWALKDVSFDIEQGDRVGIIGKNGAGKSTLLKILSRITAPTEGRVKIKGRIVSLLEVGTGFHPELTGRENIYLNGAILGMKRRQVAKKLDEIIAFSEIEKFIDTPVKRYSSGMYVRLAFAVAAHLDSDILLADEVLAVGDSAFQKKCLGKMEDVSRNQGRTVLFVSHNMSAVEQLCRSGVILKNGSLYKQAEKISDLISEYHLGLDQAGVKADWHVSSPIGEDSFRPEELSIFDNSIGKPVASFPNNHDIDFIIEFKANEIVRDQMIGIIVYNDREQEIFYSTNLDGKPENWVMPILGKNRFRVKLPMHFLNEGHYRVEIVASIYNQRWILAPGESPMKAYFSINGGLSESPYWLWARKNICAPILDWKAE